MNEERRTSRFIIASNRLPVVLSRDGDAWHSEPGSGGLVTALAPVMRGRGGTWIGWPGVAAEDGDGVDRELAASAQGYALKAVHLTAEEHALHYQGCSNEVFWPLFHDLHWQARFDPALWVAYQQVNGKFADVIAGISGVHDLVWVHDYHLMTTAQELRVRGVAARLGFFLHIPFPPLDIYAKLPWRLPLLDALLCYDLIGFQTQRDRRNFLQCVRAFFRDLKVAGKGQVVVAAVAGREVRLGVFPIGIDFGEFAGAAAGQDVAERAARLHAEAPGDQMILGVDRLDYTKGIPQRLMAFRIFLARHPELRRRVTFVQVVVPSRQDVAKYDDLKNETERLVGEINGEFTESGWVPIHYIFHAISRFELLGYYRASEVALITPLKDGMNLVAKEYCAASVDENCALILSEFAGAAVQLHDGALLVNPYDVEGVATAIHAALTMPADERRRRMRRLRRNVRDRDVFWWVRSFLKAAFARDLSDFPMLEGLPPHELVG